MTVEASPPFVDSKTVATAGTPVALTTRSILCDAVIIAADDTNTGVIYLVDKVTNTKKFPTGGLAAGETLTLPINNPAQIDIDASVNGEGVAWIAV